MRAVPATRVRWLTALPRRRPVSCPMSGDSVGSPPLLIRSVLPEEYARLGMLTLAAYTTLDGHVSEPDYEEELADVRTRAEAPSTTVLVAVNDDGELLGGVTYVADERSPFAEHSVDGAASIRMLAVDGSTRRSGAGEALVRACIEQARRDGRMEVVLHSTPWMTAAHTLYEKLGFVRDPSLDWDVNPQIKLISFRLTLSGIVGYLFVLFFFVCRWRWVVGCLSTTGISTGVPKGSNVVRVVIAALLMRMQPWLASVPSFEVSLLPWMPTSASPPLNVCKTSEKPDSP